MFNQLYIVYNKNLEIKMEVPIQMYIPSYSIQ